MTEDEMAERFTRSELTKAIVAYLAQHEKGARIGYDELSRIVGEKITVGHSKLNYARKLLIKEHNQVWDAIPKTGLVRLDDVGIAKKLARWHLPTARNKLKRGGTQSRFVDTKQLSIDEQSHFAVDCLQQELASQSLSRATRNKLAKVARGTSNDLPSFNALEWMIPLTRPRKPKET
jgi:hypothetical protein